MNPEQLRAELIRYISTELLDGKDIGLDGSTPLLEWGIINSMSLLALISHFEGLLGARIPPEEVVAKNFETVDAVVTLLGKHVPRVG